MRQTDDQADAGDKLTGRYPGRQSRDSVKKRGGQAAPGRTQAGARRPGPARDARRGRAATVAQATPVHNGRGPKCRVQRMAMPIGGVHNYEIMPGANNGASNAWKANCATRIITRPAMPQCANACRNAPGKPHRACRTPGSRNAPIAPGSQRASNAAIIGANACYRARKWADQAVIVEEQKK